MKKLVNSLMIIGLMVSSVAYAANREQARQITDQLNTFVAPSQDTAPNRALLYKSNRNNVDDTTVTTNLAITVTPTTVTITRADGISLDRCSADFGTATVSGTTIVVNTTRLPIRVLCSNTDGSLRAFYTTYKQ